MDDQPVLAEQPANSSSASSFGWTKLLSQAAVLCLMVGVAVWAGRASVGQPRIQNADSDSSGNAPGDPAGGYTTVLSPDVPASALPPDQLADPNQRLNSNGLTNVGYSPHQDSVEQMLQPMFDQKSHGVFRDHGYRVNEEPVIFVVHGQGGEQYLVPRRNVSFIAQPE